MNDALGFEEKWPVIIQSSSVSFSTRVMTSMRTYLWHLSHTPQKRTDCYCEGNIIGKEGPNEVLSQQPTDVL
jgi:hypothetical protein